jgi:hypothetical protein
MADTLEHLAWPPRLAADGTIATVPQESDEEIAGCMAAIILWPAGTRELNPDFGTPDQAFLIDGANLDEIRTALLTNEDRALESVTQDDDQLANFVSAVTVGWRRNDAGAEL